MSEIRRASAADAVTLAEQRVRMFADAGLASEPEMDAMRSNFVEWVRVKLEDDSYAGWLVEDGGQPVAGAGLWVMEWPPHFLDANP